MYSSLGLGRRICVCRSHYRVALVISSAQSSAQFVEDVLTDKYAYALNIAQSLRILFSKASTAILLCDGHTRMPIPPRSHPTIGFISDFFPSTVTNDFTQYPAWETFLDIRRAVTNSVGSKMNVTMEPTSRVPWSA